MYEAALDPAHTVVALALHNRHINAFVGGSSGSPPPPVAVSIQSFTGQELWCNALQHAVTHCNTLQHTTTHWKTLQRTATHCNALQRTATHCNAPQRIAMHCSILYQSKVSGFDARRRLAVTLAIHCNILQSTAAHFRTLAHCDTKDR